MPPSIKNDHFVHALHLLGAALYTVMQAKTLPPERNPEAIWNALPDEEQAVWIRAGLTVAQLVLAEPEEWARVVAQTKTALRAVHDE